eukprot:98030-Rhodomonas_salina.1
MKVLAAILLLVVLQLSQAFSPSLMTNAPALRQSRHSSLPSLTMQAGDHTITSRLTSSVLIGAMLACAPVFANTASAVDAPTDAAYLLAGFRPNDFSARPTPKVALFSLLSNCLASTFMFDVLVSPNHNHEMDADRSRCDDRRSPRNRRHRLFRSW